MRLRDSRTVRVITMPPLVVIAMGVVVGGIYGLLRAFRALFGDAPLCDDCVRGSAAPIATMVSVILIILCIPWAVSIKGAWQRDRERLVKERMHRASVEHDQGQLSEPEGGSGQLSLRDS